ncbi:MAG: SpoIIE family protein phosphatase [Eubacterium sp.]|nr:SpoIIE family protein phosphatase [Eubacterium sp.]
MKRIGKIVFGGLGSKIFNLCLLLVVVAITAFALIGVFQLRSLSVMTEENGETQAEVIKEQSQKTMTEQTENMLLTGAVASANYVDGEFWTLKHDFNVLALQIQTIIDHPEQFVEKEIYPPKKKNGGKMSAQLMMADTKKGADPESLTILRKIANLEPMMKEIVEGNDRYTMDCIAALPSGVSLVVDSMADQKFEEDGSIKDYDARERPWYKGAVETKKQYFSPAIHSYFYNLTEVVFGTPIYSHGKLICVLEGSMKLDVLQQMLAENKAGETGFTVLINDQGQIIYSPIKEGDLAMDKEMSISAFETDNEKLKQIIRTAMFGESGFEPVEMNGIRYYASYAPVDTVGWTLMMFIPEEELTEATNDLLQKVDAVAQDTKDKFNDSFRDSSRITFLVLVLLLVNAIVASIYFARKLIKPIDAMTKKVETITGDNLVFEVEDIYKTGDEIEVLANAFSEMSEQTRNYIEEIMHIQAEKERIGTELAIATNIQADMLPNEFPLYPDRKEFEVFASMTPAKEVGGDFYDIFLIDEDHLALVMADVSGKGVPAAMFMVRAMTSIRDRAMMGGTPAEILMKVNERLCEKNAESLFVTAFLAILTISTGELVEANAGHEFPAIRHKGEEFQLIQDNHGFVLGGYPSMKQTDQFFRLNPGDTLFLYTDGVPEATNVEEEMFETDRMLEALNQEKDAGPEQLLTVVKEQVEAFVGEEPQFDDLTMLSITYHGK